ncbi:sec-independent protein translocase protein TatB [Stella humosa]|uniref:Sec-independent protein translocase protein TatB n=1 Tax=Stella humosa TaxID=94 RepID=A0A3N1M878_9PROT|nr:Sec-independent protein translocase protein TatB [Stella humosa]ROP99880.1 sec-independent protein translocase protein TatB [Stella humosa]BBK30890.1 hypothetical protein STHU_15240 [Stella humosa]
MFDIGWSELAVIAVVALVVIGPKDLPKVLRTVGLWVAKARAVARDFQSSVDEMAREADLQDVKKQLDELRSTNVSELIEKHVDPQGEMRKAFEPPPELSHDPFAEPEKKAVDYVPPPDPTMVEPTVVEPMVVEPTVVGSGQAAPTPTTMPALDTIASAAAVPDVPPPAPDAAFPDPAAPPKPPAGAA